MPRRFSRARCRGFTLVELLVVITIIGILAMLTLGGVQRGLAAARRIRCFNNLKQLALGACHHQSTHGFFPSGGWGWGWVGDPDREFGRTQPGGWGFSILPFIDQQTLHSVAAHQADARKQVLLGEMAGTPLPIFICPERRRAIAYPYVAQSSYYNTRRPSRAGRSDYAACAGTLAPGEDKGPTSIPGAETYNWPQSNHNGVCYQRSEVSAEMVRKDGLSNTYLLGERNLNPDNYATGTALDDDQCLYVGHASDVLRWAADRPKPDRPGVANYWVFGSAHPGLFHMAFCDGSVHRMVYGIDLEVHRRLGCRNDGLPVDLSSFAD